MSEKIFIVDEIEIKIQKKRNNRRIRLSINSYGEVRVSIPIWARYDDGLKFINTKLDWIKQKRPTTRIYTENMLIGKSHRLRFVPNNKFYSQIKENEIFIGYPSIYQTKDRVVQEYASKAIQKVLKIESLNLLKIRLDTLSTKLNLKYNNLKIRYLKSRWGSCDVHQNITLNQNLINLPWNLIDYVLVHELIHTKIMNHGQDFWNNFKIHMPDYQERRKVLKSNNF